MEVLFRKSIDMLSEFQASSKFKLSNIDQRLTTMERKLDFIEASLKHCDPSLRGIQHIPIQGSVFDKTVRRDLIKQSQLKRRKSRKLSLSTIKTIINPHSSQKLIKISVSNNNDNIACDDEEKQSQLKTDRTSRIPPPFPPSLMIPPTQDKENNAPFMDIDLSKYEKMKNIGVPLQAVIAKMKSDEIDASVMDYFAKKHDPDYNANVSNLKAKSQSLTSTPSPTLSSIDSTFFDRASGRINRTGSLHAKYGPPPKLPRSPSPIGHRKSVENLAGAQKKRALPSGLAAQIQNKNNLKSLKKVDPKPLKPATMKSNKENKIEPKKESKSQSKPVSKTVVASSLPKKRLPMNLAAQIKNLNNAKSLKSVSAEKENISSKPKLPIKNVPLSFAEQIANANAKRLKQSKSAKVEKKNDSVLQESTERERKILSPIQSPPQIPLPALPSLAIPPSITPSPSPCTSPRVLPPPPSKRKVGTGKPPPRKVGNRTAPPPPK